METMPHILQLGAPNSFNDISKRIHHSLSQTNTAINAAKIVKLYSILPQDEDIEIIHFNDEQDNVIGIHNPQQVSEYTNKIVADIKSRYQENSSIKISLQQKNEGGYIRKSIRLSPNINGSKKQIGDVFYRIVSAQ